MKKTYFVLSLVLLSSIFSLDTWAAAGKKHYPGVFIGSVNTSGDSEVTYGIEYEFKFDQNWGAGLIFETIPDGKKGAGIDVYIASGFYHPNKNWRLGFGLGTEKIGGKKPKDKNIAKISIAYEVFVGDLIIAPSAAVDFIEGGDEAFVIGAAVIYPF